MRVAITGGRKFTNRALLETVLDATDISQLIVGDAEGADRFAREWAVNRNVPWKLFRANWRVYKKAAGSIRNQEMLDKGKPEKVLAFPDPESVGTWDMVRQARKRQISVEVFE